jgi:heme A synthase
MIEFVHQRIAYATMLYMLVVGLWGLASYVRKSSLPPSYLGALVLGEALVVVQALVGALLLGEGLAPGNPMHYLYGFTALIALPLAYSYNQGRTDRRALLIYAIVALFVFGAAVRATTTAFGGA